jgi:ketosteroid isomerase-like protein
VFQRGFTPQRATITLHVFFSHPGSSVSTERNKNTIKRFFDAFLNGRNEEMRAFLTNDAKWWINGKSGGPIAVQTWYDQITTMFSKARMPLDLEILSITAEDDRVSLEGRSRVYFGKINFLYENEYHFMFQLRDDHICSVREYLDTEYMAKIMPILATA